MSISDIVLGQPLPGAARHVAEPRRRPILGSLTAAITRRRVDRATASRHTANTREWDIDVLAASAQSWSMLSRCSARHREVLRRGDRLP